MKMRKSCVILSVFVLSCVTARGGDEEESEWEEVRLRREESEWEEVRLRRETGDDEQILCTLPPYPENGYYVVGGNSSLGPGDKVMSAQLNVSCHPRYRPSGNNIIFCWQNNWSGELPECVRFCKLDRHPSVKYQCQVTSKESEGVYYRNCNNDELSGTVVRPQCEPNYHFDGILHHMHCNEGKWDYIAICQPECGTVSSDATALIIHGRDSAQGEFPWHAGIYKKMLFNDTATYMLICGGSLVSRSIVISAAHCFWDKHTYKINPVTSYAVALGKYYRGWNNPQDEKAQKFEISSINIPATYQDAKSNYQSDIAIVRLTNPAEYASNVRPVCLDFEPHFEQSQLRIGHFGKVAGWGIHGNDEKGKFVPILQVIELPYVDIVQCLEESPSTFRPYVTKDKICAGYTNGSALCRGDSGGGLVFKEKDRGVERYYLRGLVSAAAPPDSELACNAFTRTTFTKITEHKDFIEKNTVAVDQIAAQKESDALCILPPYPRNGTYEMKGAQYAQPGQGYCSVYLSFYCEPEFKLRPPVDLVFCAFGQWDEEIPKCVPKNLNAFITASLLG